MDILVKLAKRSKSMAIKLDVSHGPTLMVSHLVQRNGKRSTISLVNYNQLNRYDLYEICSNKFNSLNAKIMNE